MKEPTNEQTVRLALAAIFIAANTAGTGGLTAVSARRKMEVGNALAHADELLKQAGIVDTERKRDAGLIVNVNKCARCGKDHKGVQFYPLSNPADEFDRWGTCPETGEPIALKCIEAEGVPPVTQPKPSMRGVRHEGK